MLYLLDADTLIKADNKFFKRKWFPKFWEWLIYQGTIGNVKVPLEQYNEVVKGKGDLVSWLKTAEVKEALLLDEEIDSAVVERVIAEGYASDLDDAEVIKIGQDPFLIGCGASNPTQRTVVSFENSAPSKIRANRKVPDVCKQFGVKCIDLHQMLDELDYSNDWMPPKK